MPAKEKTFKNASTHLPLKLPKPKIQKIELSDQDKEDIKAMIEGRPTKAQLEKWEKRGYSPGVIRRYNPGQLSSRIDQIRKKYFHGLCKVCHKFPLYKITYNMGGAKLLEYYCEQHLDKMKNI